MKQSAGIWTSIYRIFYAVVFVSGFLAVPVSVWSSGLAPHLPGQVLVKLKGTAGPRALNNFLSRYQTTGVRHFRTAGIVKVDLAPGMQVDKAIDLLSKDPAVEYVEPDYLLRPQQVPNDPDFNKQWYLENTGQVTNGYVGKPGADIDAVTAWQRTGNNAQITVAVIDSGVDLDHPDIVSSLWSNPGEIPANGIDDDGNGKIDDIHGWDFVDNDNLPQDATGHGTHVAGIIAAATDNGVGIAGLAKNARIMALRFIDGFDLGATSDAIAAIEYALDNGATIINCSWGSAYYSYALRDTMAAADALFICAAGNNAGNNDAAPFYPASYDSWNVLAVAATNSQDSLAWFSNYGNVSVDLAAPGSNIYSARPGRRLVWEEYFSNGQLDGWQTGGGPDTWSVTGPGEEPGISGVLAQSPAGNYLPNTDTWAATPGFSLADAAAAMLTFQIIGESEAGHDFLYVEGTTDDVNWLPLRLKIGSGTPVGSISGTLPFWTRVTVDLGRFDGKPFCRLRFRFVSDDLNQSRGWYLDGFHLTASDEQSGGYRYLNGTSMAAAVVTGAAAMTAGTNPALGPDDLKMLLSSGVDSLDFLKNVVASGGRLNVSTTVYLAGSVVLNSRAASERQIDLEWVINTDVVDDLTVERRSQSQKDFFPIARVSPDAGSFLDTGLIPGTTYVYRVRTLTSDGKPAVSNQATATTPYVGGAGGSGGCFISVINP